MARGINWAEEFPELGTPKKSIDSLECLLKADMRKLLRKIIKSDTTRKKHGCLSKMVAASKCSIGTYQYQFSVKE